MRPSEFLSIKNLHDSLINSILLQETELDIELELCNWKQDSYQENEEEMIFGQLTFSNVSNYQVSPKDFVPDSNEILEVQISDSMEVSGAEKIKMVLSDENDVVIITFEAANVTWQSQF